MSNKQNEQNPITQRFNEQYSMQMHWGGNADYTHKSYFKDM